MGRLAAWLDEELRLRRAERSRLRFASVSATPHHDGVAFRAVVRNESSRAAFDVVVSLRTGAETVARSDALTIRAGEEVVTDDRRALPRPARNRRGRLRGRAFQASRQRLRGAKLAG
jgi:hypothetical protein